MKRRIVPLLDATPADLGPFTPAGFRAREAVARSGREVVKVVDWARRANAPAHGDAVVAALHARALLGARFPWLALLVGATALEAALPRGTAPVALIEITARALLAVGLSATARTLLTSVRRKLPTALADVLADADDTDDAVAPLLLPGPGPGPETDEGPPALGFAVVRLPVGPRRPVRARLPPASRSRARSAP